MEKIIKNCRGVKQCNNGVNRFGKENQRENFRTISGFRILHNKCHRKNNTRFNKECI